MIRIQCVPRTMTNRRIFRTLARDNVGESMEPGENEVMYFGRHSVSGDVVSCASLCTADPSVSDSAITTFYHWLTFLFVNKDYQRYVHGAHMLSDILVEAVNKTNRPIRVEAAYKAVTFFKKCGFQQINPVPKECIAGSKYFRYLYLMEKKYGNREEIWDC